MIDQTKDKKDDVLAEKLDAKKQDPNLAQKLAKEEKEKAELAKQAQKADQKAKAQPDNNTANAMQPIGSAKVTADKAEIHAEPGKKGSVVGTMTAQKKVEILDKKGDELKVLVNGKVGYISAAATDYVQNEKKEDKKTAPVPTGTATVACASLNIRKGPNKEEASMGTLRQADRVNVYGEKDGFLEVHIGDQIGYISAEFTDRASKNKGKAVKPKEGNALEQATPELQVLLSRETLTAAEMAQAREMIAQAPESARGDLYEALQTKPAMGKEERGQSKDGASYEHLATSLELLGIQNPSSEMSYTAYLEQLKRDQKLPESGGMQNWGALANAMGVSYNMMCAAGNRTGLEKNFWSTAVREQLRQGHAVMACIQNQAVRIEAVDDKGLVITLPEWDNVGFTGLGNGWQTYHGKAEQKGRGKRGILAFESLADAGLQWVIGMG